jgi:hypothetical protein
VSTDDLIDTLSTNLPQVRRLRPPLLRAAFWLVLALAVLSLLAFSQGIRPDIWDRLQDRSFVVTLAGALLTGITGAIAAFTLSLPDRSRKWIVLPIAPLVFWISHIGYQCLTNWVSFDPAGMTLGETTRCFATLVFTSLPLSVALFLMLKYAVFVRPMAVALIGGLAISALTAAALSLFHVLDASILVVMWNLGTAVLIVGLSSLLTRRYVGHLRGMPFGNIG